MKKTLGMVFFLTVLAGMAGCGQKKYCKYNRTNRYPDGENIRRTFLFGRAGRTKLQCDGRIF